MKNIVSKLVLFSALITAALPWSTASAHELPQFNQVATPQAANSSVTASLSSNWSGYAASGNTYSSVSGTWTVPSVTASQSIQADAAWVGIGGLAGTDLIQAGTQIITENGTTQYQAWYETLPNASTDVFAVNPGDSITVNINELATNQWFIYIADNTSGKNYSTVVNYTSSQDSVEWIEEMPSNGTSYIPLDNFGTVPFTGATATVNGQSETLAQTGAHALAMTNGNAITAAPTVIGTNGESFTVSRTNQASGVSAQVIPTYRGSWRVGRGDQGQGQSQSISVAIPDLSSIFPSSSVSTSSQPQTRTVYVPGVGEVTEVSQSYSSSDGSISGYSYSFSF